MNCSNCGGSGKCPVCDGKKKINGGICDECQGTGVCFVCNGSGSK